MKYKELLGFKISGLTLGTVALGLDYTVFAGQNKPTKGQSMAILDAAVRAGINSIDTARNYGDAEDIIRTFTNENDKVRLNIITKFKISPSAITNKDRARAEMMTSVKESLVKLGLDRLSICLFHNDTSLPFDHTRRIVPELLEEIKHLGLIEHGGVSVDSPLELEAFMDHPIIEAVQVPVNVFDQRLINEGIFQQLSESNRLVFARSIFLKGLLFMKPEQLKGNLLAGSYFLRQLNQLAQEAEISVSQLAFSYVRDIDGVTSIVFGADNPSHVRQNVELLGRAKLPEDLRVRIQSLFTDIPETIITPRKWSF